MKKWYPEGWRFKIEVLKVGKENQATECRFGLEVVILSHLITKHPTGLVQRHSSRCLPLWSQFDAMVICASWAGYPVGRRTSYVPIGLCASESLAADKNKSYHV